MDDFTAYANDLRIDGFSPRAIDTYLRVLKKIPYELPGTPRDAKGWLAEQSQTVSLATLAVYVRALKSYGSWWAGEYQQPDPLERLEHPKVPHAKPGRIAPNDDVQRVLATLTAYATDYRNPVRDRAIFSTFAYTGMRRSELARLQLDDISFDDRRLIVRPGKNGEGRQIPLHQDLARDLRRYLNTERRTHPHASCDEVFLGSRGALRADSIHGVMTRIGEYVGIDPPIQSHELRRRLAREWVDQGGADDALMLIGGWRSPTMPARYRAEAAGDLAARQYERIFGASEQAQPARPGRKARRLVRPAP